jgi:peroxiredoxin
MAEPGEPILLVKPGDRAEDFTLKDQDDQAFEFRNNAGNWTLLSFHPLAWTSFCTGQMTFLEKHTGTFASLNTTAVGISVGSFLSRRPGLTIFRSRTRLLSDFWPHGGVEKTHGLFREANGFSERADVILDETMKILFVHPVFKGGRGETEKKTGEYLRFHGFPPLRKQYHAG